MLLALIGLMQQLLSKTKYLSLYRTQSTVICNVIKTAGQRCELFCDRCIVNGRSCRRCVTRSMQRVAPATTTSPACVSETSTLDFDYVTLEDLHHLHHHHQQQQQLHCYEPTTSRLTSDDNNNDDNDAENYAGVYSRCIIGSKMPSVRCRLNV